MDGSQQYKTGVGVGIRYEMVWTENKFFIMSKVKIRGYRCYFCERKKDYVVFNY